MPARYFTVQDAFGVYQFEGAGEALAALLAEPDHKGTLFGLDGKPLAHYGPDGYHANAALPVVLSRPGTDDAYAVLVHDGGEVSGGPFQAPLVTTYLQHGWMAA